MYRNYIETSNASPRSTNKTKQRLPVTLHRFLAILALGLLVSRIHTTPSFLLPYEDEDEPKNGHLPALSSWENQAFGDVMPNFWRQWLEEHERSNHTDLSILKIEPTSLHTDWGCGISIQLLFETRSRLEPIPSSTKTFFKASHADMLHYDAESHLREIKAYYLDRILKTNVVLPCIGYHLDRRQITDDQDWSTIAKNLECIQPSNGDTKTTVTVEGSIMLWMNGLESVSKERIVEETKKSIENHNEGTSAMNYAIFHYLGACMKSEHNHFSQRPKRNKNSARTYVAIDNDRCMTPKAIFSNRDTVPDLHFNRIKLWETLVYERICQVPHRFFPVIEVVREAAASKNSISSRLGDALQNDALSSELLESQPEAFDEIDQRVHRLAEYIFQNCPEGG